ncbi:hypothetical protein [Streptomyces sp900116325]|uniref:YD repeat-containing protein n=1 Tax=Streptomyces sp. 900116325 TaxID=3154295 RepID=A0ABV2UMW4_9ACTN
MRYQYRRGETDTWHDVPVGDVTRSADGSVQPTSETASYDGFVAPYLIEIDHRARTALAARRNGGSRRGRPHNNGYDWQGI